MNARPEFAKPRHHITIIEDEADIAGLLAHCFACEGFQVTTARDGDAGLGVIHRHRPDLVILDLMLPAMSGWDVFVKPRSVREVIARSRAVLRRTGTAHEPALFANAARESCGLNKNPCGLRFRTHRTLAVPHDTA